MRNTHRALSLQCMDHICQINSSKGGVPKLPVKDAYVSKEGIAGDKQKNKKYHGGPDRALCIFSIREIEKLQAQGHPIFPGSTGENLTIDLKDYSKLIPGVKIQLGEEVVIEITSYTMPCKTIAASFTNGSFMCISQKINPGGSRVYAKVLKPGWIHVEDRITLFE